MSGESSDIVKIFGPALENAAEAKPVSAEAGVPNSGGDGSPVDSEKVNTPSMSSLAQFVMKHMRINYDARSTTGMDARLRYSAMAQTCTYDAKQKAYLADIGINERVYSPVTSVKTRAAKSMLMELASYFEEPPFAISPTPDPDVPNEIAEEVMRKVIGEVTQIFSQLQQTGVEQVPPQVMQNLQMLIIKATDVGFAEGESKKEDFARKTAKRLEKKVWDMMIEGGYVEAVASCLDDACTYGTCVMKGPFLRNLEHNAVIKDKNGGVRKFRRVIDAVPCYESISPVDCYPAPGAKDISDGCLCVRVRYTREQLWKFSKSSANGKKRKDAEGWREIAIRDLLSRHDLGVQLTEFPSDASIREITKNEPECSNDCKFEGIDFFGYVEGRHLLSIGITKSMDGNIIEGDEMYYVETIVIGGNVVFCRIYDERIGCPLSKGVFYSVPGSWWGESIADKLVSCQSLMNNAIISLLRNMGTSSAPMGWINDASRLVDKSPNALTAEPGKIFAFGSSFAGQTGQGAPMGILNIPSNANELLSVAGYVNKQADIDSGIPAFSEGTGGSNGGALRTAEGLKTYTEASTRGCKTIATCFDHDITVGTARRTANFIMMQDEDTDLRGDVEIRAVGMMGKILKAQNDQARLQLFNMCLNSQFMQQIVGVKGIMEFFRPSLKDVGVNPDNVVPSDERMEMLEEIEKIKMVFQATANANGVQENVGVDTQQDNTGMQSGIAPVAQPGGVSQRRGVA